MKKLKIGIIGIGTVGTGLLKIIEESGISISKISGLNLQIIGIVSKNIEKLKNRYSYPIYTDYKKLTQDSEVDLIVELVGGTGVAYDIVKDSLINKKTVVTANKALISSRSEELFLLAKNNKVEIGYEGSVGGAIPIIHAVNNSLIGNEYDSVYGILNGTSNFILSKMEFEKINFSEALKKAQELGFAEQDPTFDIEGIDTAHKISILASLVYGASIPIEKIKTNGIKKIKPIDIKISKELGFRIKLLGWMKKITKNSIQIGVDPVLLPITHSFANIMNEENSVYLNTSYSGPMMLVGKGAGGIPTASAVLSDILFLGMRRLSNFNFHQKPLETIQVLDGMDNLNKNYIRIKTKDKLGVLSEITSSLGKNGVSISLLRQDESNQETTDIIIMTHPSNGLNVEKAMKEIVSSPNIIPEETVKFRIEDNL